MEAETKSDQASAVAAHPSSPERTEQHSDSDRRIAINSVKVQPIKASHAPFTSYLAMVSMRAREKLAVASISVWSACLQRYKLGPKSAKPSLPLFFRF